MLEVSYVLFVSSNATKRSFQKYCRHLVHRRVFTLHQFKHPNGRLQINVKGNNDINLKCVQQDQ